jgi:hypothetical protein
MKRVLISSRTFVRILFLIMSPHLVRVRILFGSEYALSPSKDPNVPLTNPVKPAFFSKVSLVLFVCVPP